MKWLTFATILPLALSSPASSATLSLDFTDTAFDGWLVGRTAATAEVRRIPIRAELVRIDASGPEVVWAKTLNKPRKESLGLKAGDYRLYVQDERSGLIFEFPEQVRSPLILEVVH